MKYLRKIIWLVIAVAFLASVIIGTGVIFSVKNVNVTLNSYSYSDWDEMTEEEQSNALAEINDIKQTVLNKYGGKLISYVDKDELAASFGDSLYILESCEKVYPCTLNITVKERREVFAILNADGTSSTYDSLGILMRSGISAEDAINNIDKAPNVLVYGTTTDEQIASVANAASVFAEKFSSLRSIIDMIYLHERADSIIFKFRCGIEVYIADYTNLTAVKFQVAYNKFMTLSGEEKLFGEIMVTETNRGIVSAERFERGLLDELL